MGNHIICRTSCGFTDAPDGGLPLAEAVGVGLCQPKGDRSACCLSSADPEHLPVEWFADAEWGRSVLSDAGSMSVRASSNSKSIPSRSVVQAVPVEISRNHVGEGIDRREQKLEIRHAAVTTTGFTAESLMCDMDSNDDECSLDKPLPWEEIAREDIGFNENSLEELVQSYHSGAGSQHVSEKEVMHLEAKGTGNYKF
eukprot:gnl/MRDRNA2_/MRDRNA2_50928_c0_seq1.p1 gnl/MRDRNA2_/MRDRNA2_50928_c0~~gnl/MRDRNA2_/MRDRNA2_50928_c0_seq1.p1  ORF type:complete len:198 (+),score=39.51 gnl/MRDRNA2_/MRDRNA2_50928_c0_seq1:91-684(+)